ncbi:hypothetical protein ABTZ46_17915 [Nocardioides sp. NPDC126508]
MTADEGRPDLDLDLRAVLDWLKETECSDFVDEDDVPGTTADERQLLAALGGLARAVLDDPSMGDGLDALSSVPDLKAWISRGPTPPCAVIEAGLRLSRSSEHVAALYSSTVASGHRRRLGTFFTPPGEVTRMLAACEEEGVDPASVVDVGAGVGIFSIAAANQWPSAVIAAVDVNPVTLGLLGVRAAAEALLSTSPEAPGVRLRLADFVQYVGTEYPASPGPRLVLGNPPYTRLQLLPREDRQRLLEAAGGLCGSRASLSALMTAAAINRLAAEDALCLLLPAQWLEADYADGLRNWIWTHTNRSVRLTLFDTGLFKEAQVDAVSLLVGPEREGDQPMATSLPDGARHRLMDRSGPCPGHWRSLFADESADGAELPPTETVPLSTVARIVRGTATGANAFFLLTPQQLADHPLPSTVFFPMVRRLRDHPGESIDEAALANLPERDRRWLFLAQHTDLDDDQVAAYVDHGQAEGYPDRYLCSYRREWFDLSTEVVVPDVIVGPSSKTEFRFVVNEAAAYITNNLYGLSWKTEVPPATRTAVLSWLRGPQGQAAIRARARSHGDRLSKIEPRALNALPIPATLVRDIPAEDHAQPTLWS